MRHCAPIRGRTRRMVSRTRRRIRLRTLDLPSARDAVNPIFGPSAPPASRQNATKLRDATLVPSSYTFWNSERFSSRLDFENSRRACSPVAAGLAGGLDGPFVTDSQLVASGGPAAGKHGAAVLGLHPGAKPVTLRTAVVVRLKCSLRHKNPSGMPTLPGGAIASATPWWRKFQYTGACGGVSIRALPNRFCIWACTT